MSQESKDWVVNNRACDAPGSWFCPGKYPPALRKILDEKKDFKQLEDFNIKGGDDSEYQKEYFKNLNGDGGASVNRGKDAEKNVPKKRKITSAQIEKMNTEWHNTELTTMMYDLISKNSIKELQEIFDKSPHFAHIRSEDGRGPMFWAHELRRQEIIDMMKKLNVSETRTDANGKTPLDK